MEHASREGWLAELISLLWPDFAAQGYLLAHQLRASVGWPSRGALARKKRRLGECWAATASGDGSIEIFISPVLEDVGEVGATLVHELVHAAVGPACGHKGPFKRLATGIGLEGPMRATYAGPRLRERLNALTEQLGPYPHASLDGLHRRKEGTRLLKVECPVDGYTARITRRWITVGLPQCPYGHPMQQSMEGGKRGGGEA